MYISPCPRGEMLEAYWSIQRLFLLNFALVSFLLHTYCCILSSISPKAKKQIRPTLSLQSPPPQSLAASSTRHIYPCQAFLVKSKVCIMSPGMGIGGGMTLLPPTHTNTNTNTLTISPASHYYYYLLVPEKSLSPSLFGASLTLPRPSPQRFSYIYPSSLSSQLSSPPAGQHFTLTLIAAKKAFASEWDKADCTGKRRRKCLHLSSP